MLMRAQRMLAVPGLIEIGEAGGLDSTTRNWVISLRRSSSATCRTTRGLKPWEVSLTGLYGVGIVRVEPVLTFLRFPSRRLHSNSQPRGDEIPVGIPLARYPPDGPGWALVSASGSYLG